MLICHFSSSLDPSRGGVASGIVQISKQLMNYGIGNQIFTFGNTPRQIARISKIFAQLQSIGVDCNYTVGYFKNDYGIGSFRGLRNKLKNLDKPDLVVIHQIYTFSTLIGYIYAKKHKIPYAIFPHGSLTKYHESDSKVMKFLAKRICISKILNEADAIIVTCESEKNDLNPVLQSKVSFLGYGAILNRTLIESVSSETGENQNSHIVFSGRFDKKKNLPLLIEAMPSILDKYPNLTLDIAGSGTPKELEALQSLVASLNLERHIYFHGWVENSKMLELFSRARLLVLPSENENFAIVVAEALSIGLPCVLSKFVGTADIVAKYGAGEIINELTSISVADGILRVLQGDELSYREAAFMAVEQSLDWSKIASRWRDLVTSLS